MNQNTALKYFLYEHKKPVILYYSILITTILLLFAVMEISVSQSGDNVTGSFSSLELVTVIFLFVAGITGFKESFGMLLQNGLSRKTAWKARILFTLLLSVIMASADKLLVLLLNLLSHLSDKISVAALYENLYVKRCSKYSAFQIGLEGYFYDFVLYAGIIALGYFIALLFYHINKTGRILIGAGIPILLLVVLPVCDSLLLHNTILPKFLQFLDLCFGITKSNPLHAIVTFFILFAACNLLSWFFMRKAVIKN